MATEYIEKVELPSRGILYHDEIPPEFTLRAMTTKEEKMLVGSGEEAIKRIISACIKEPANVDFDKLILADQHFLLVKLRALSYGSDYNVSFTCGKCGTLNQNKKINLDEMDINTLDEEFCEPYNIELPISKVIVGLRLLRYGDLMAADRRARKFAKKGQVEAGDMGMIYRLVYSIDSIEGKKATDFNATQAFVEQLIGRDSAFLHDKLNKIKVGYDTDLLESCYSCGEDVEFTLPLTSEFFRPTFE